MYNIEEFKKQTYVDKEFLVSVEGVDNGAYVLNDSDVDELIQIVRDECAPKWVSVGDKLPVDGSYVLCLMSEGASFSRSNRHCCEYTDKYGFDRSRVTHWMPLPEGPKQ